MKAHILMVLFFFHSLEINCLHLQQHLLHFSIVHPQTAFMCKSCPENGMCCIIFTIICYICTFCPDTSQLHQMIFVIHTIAWDDYCIAITINMPMLQIQTRTVLVYHFMDCTVINLTTYASVSCIKHYLFCLLCVCFHCFFFLWARSLPCFNQGCVRVCDLLSGVPTHMCKFTNLRFTNLKFYIHATVKSIVFCHRRIFSGLSIK